MQICLLKCEFERLEYFKGQNKLLWSARTTLGQFYFFRYGNIESTKNKRLHRNVYLPPKRQKPFFESKRNVICGIAITRRLEI